MCVQDSEEGGGAGVEPIMEEAREVIGPDDAGPSLDPSGCWNGDRMKEGKRSGRAVREEAGAMCRSPLGAGSLLGLGPQRDHNVTPTLSTLLCGKQDCAGAS